MVLEGDDPYFYKIKKLNLLKKERLPCFNTSLNIVMYTLE